MKMSLSDDAGRWSTVSVCLSVCLVLSSTAGSPTASSTHGGGKVFPQDGKGGGKGRTSTETQAALDELTQRRLLALCDALCR